MRYLIGLGRELGLPLCVVRQLPAQEILYQRAFDRLAQQDLDDAQRRAKGKPPKQRHPTTAKARAQQEYAAWVNAFEL